MKWILFLILISFLFISFNSNPEVIDKVQYKYQCENYTSPFVFFGYSETVEGCQAYATQSAQYPACISSGRVFKTFSQTGLNNKYVQCEYEIISNGNTGYQRLISASNVNDVFECPSTHPIETEDGRCDNGISICQENSGTRANDIGWDSDVYGKTSGQYACNSESCEVKVTNSYCTSEKFNGFDCIAQVSYTGNSCSGSSDADLWSCPDGATCNNITPTHTPDDPTSEIEQPSSPDSPNTQPNDVQVPDVEDVAEREGDGDVLESILNMNSDMNLLLSQLNEHVNESNAKELDQLTMLNESLLNLQKTNLEIYENEKKLTQQLNSDLVTATNENTNKLGSKLDGIKTAIENSGGGGSGGSSQGVENALGEIGGSLDGIAETDTSGAGQGTCIESQTCEGFYESLYPDGIGPIFTEQIAKLKTTSVDGFVGSFSDLNLSGGSAPSFTFEVMDFGSFTLFDNGIDFSWIMSFIRAAMMFSTVILCRKIVLGG